MKLFFMIMFLTFYVIEISILEYTYMNVYIYMYKKYFALFYIIRSFDNLLALNFKEYKIIKMKNAEEVYS